MKFQWIRGNTGCLFLKGNAVPVYQLSRREWVLFDSGSRREEAALLSFLEKNQIRVRAVLTSHSHYDHIGNHKTLQERFGSELVMSCLDAGMARDSLALKSCFYSSSRSRLARERSEMLLAADRVIGGRQREVVVDGVVFPILELPGHAASHLGYVTPDGAAYLGDALFDRSVWDHARLVYMLDYQLGIETMEKLKALSCPLSVLSHYGICRELPALAEENIRQVKEMLAGIRQALGPAETLETAVRKVWKALWDRPVSEEQALLLEREVRAALEYFVENGWARTEIREGAMEYVFVQGTCASGYWLLQGTQTPCGAVSQSVVSPVRQLVPPVC